MKKGIVTSCGKSDIHYLNLNILLNSIQSWNLPIEIFHQNEVTKEKQNKVKEKYNNVSFINLNFIKDNLKGYQMKPFAIYLSKFDNLLWIDNDIVPILPFDFLFDSNYDAIFWKDRYMHSSDIIKKKYNFEYEYETGVIFLKKNKIISELQNVIRMNCNYNIDFDGNTCKLKDFNGNRNLYYKHLLGDKDTFQIGFQKYKNKYVNEEKPISVGTNFFIYEIPYTSIIIKFPLIYGNYYETGLLQTYNGKNLFLHKTVYENKMGEIFYYLYNLKERQNKSELEIIEDTSHMIIKQVVNNRYYFYFPYLIIYFFNFFLSIFQL